MPSFRNIPHNPRNVLLSALTASLIVNISMGIHLFSDLQGTEAGKETDNLPQKEDYALRAGMLERKLAAERAAAQAEKERALVRRAKLALSAGSGLETPPGQEPEAAWNAAPCFKGQLRVSGIFRQSARGRPVTNIAVCIAPDSEPETVNLSAPDTPFAAPAR